ncbi:unnamed protein product [Cuscuta campestris]|uniref:Macro domain-containing protein n=1 Tax=Cuscuta campestris TaxID=132261 RepID=A0A484LVB5_9ASTE|nr:unnamed protein product [Cuscuta campestris]
MISRPVSKLGSIFSRFGRFPTTRSASTKPRNSQFQPLARYTGPTPSPTVVRGRAKFSTMASGRDDDAKVVQFQLKSSTLLKIRIGDITKWSVDGSSDAIVNPANEQMLGGYGADGAIHKAAGPELREACFKVPQVSPTIRCPTGEARITPGFRLPASHVIHTVGPIYYKHPDPKTALESSYRNCLRVAKENGIQYIAFTAISCGVYGYPFDEAANVAISTVKAHCDDLREIHFVLFADDIYDAWLKAADELLHEEEMRR